MKRSFIIIASLLVLIGSGIYLYENKDSQRIGGRVYAVGDLEINWGVPDGSPIFTLAGLLPGDSIPPYTVEVVNNGITERAVGIRGIKGTELANLSQALIIVISVGGIDLYGGTSASGPKTVAQFFVDSAFPTGIFLSSLAAGVSTNYTFTVSFPGSSGDVYQGGSLLFDLTFGITIPIPAVCQGFSFNGQTITGTGGNDTLNGTNGNDLIFGLEGYDRINGRGGIDCIVGGPGNDTIRAGSGNDGVDGGEDIDNVFGEGGNDKIAGGSGNDTLDGGGGNDTVRGGSGNDTLKGSSGNDTLIGDGDTDSANGGSGTDSCDAETEVSCEL